MEEFVTTMYFTITQKDGSKEPFGCRGYEETADTYELLLISGERRSFKKAAIGGCVCTSFQPFWADENPSS
jgi:hypothetical protein